MIRVLSYNIYYKAMSMGSNKIAKCEPIIVIGGQDRTTCLDNVAKFIEANEPYDFVGLQEATNWRIIQNLSPTLVNMNAIDHNPHLEDMVIFYDKKYQLDTSNSIIKGQMQDKGRPFIVLFFKQKLCVINVHAGHRRDIYKFDSYLINTLNLPTYKASKAAFMAKLQTYDIIMMGDFNDELLSGQFNVSGNRKLFGINKTKTCCNKNLEGIPLTSAFDHILSTYPDISLSVYHVPTASDHMPVVADINKIKNIGYDFDGVLHVDVSEPDAFGQRNPINYKGPFKPFDRIIDQIETEINAGHKIFIITARDNASLPIIKSFLNRTKLAILPCITIIFTNNQDKTQEIKNNKINIFYDDSCLRIVELYNSMQSLWKLPNLVQLFLVKPEIESWIEITFNNISQECAANSNLITLKKQNKIYPSLEAPSLASVSGGSLTKDFLFLRLDNIFSIINPNQSSINGSSFIDESSQIINQIIQQYNYRFTNPAISIMLSDLNQTINYVDKNNIISIFYSKYLDRLQYDIIFLAIQEFNNILFGNQLVYSQGQRFVADSEKNMIKLVVYFMDIIKQDPKMMKRFYYIMANNKLDFRDEQLLNAYVRMGMNQEIASMIVIFYSVLRKLIFKF